MRGVFSGVEGGISAAFAHYYIRNIMMAEPAQNTKFPYLHTLAGIVLSTSAFILIWYFVGYAIDTWFYGLISGNNLINDTCFLLPITVVEFANIFLAIKARMAQKPGYSKSYITIAIVTLAIYLILLFLMYATRY